jgi:hypothetical protein
MRMSINNESHDFTRWLRVITKGCAHADKPVNDNTIASKGEKKRRMYVDQDTIVLRFNLLVTSENQSAKIVQVFQR